jgi:hypothetical protein
MQSINAKRYIIYPALAYLCGIGCILLALLIRRLLKHYVRQDESKSALLVEISQEEVAEKALAEKLNVAAPLEEVRTVEQTTSAAIPVNVSSHLARQRNILFVVSSCLLVVSLVLGSVVIMQSHQIGEVQTSAKTNPAFVQTVVASEQAFERGIVFPDYSATAYGNSDLVWQQGIRQMKDQTGAQWIEMPILFSQATGSDTNIALSPSSPGVTAFVQGIRAAHAAGYKVFFTPFVRVRNIPAGWAGDVDLPTPQLQQAWFNNYWSAIKPYAQAAQANGVEQMAVATELQKLQNQVPDTLWDQLFTRVASVFTATRTYDMNWSSLTLPMPSWLKNPLINMIGVSSYIPLTDVDRPVPVEQIPQLWQQKIKDPLDELSIQFGKKVLITEIGYRNTSDALYRTWLSISSAPPDPQLQAQAYNAVLLNVFSDPHIGGTFFWGWDNVDQFAIKGQPAAQILQNWYSRAVQ